MVSYWLTFPPPLVSNGLLLAIPPLPPPAADIKCERPYIGCITLVSNVFIHQHLEISIEVVNEYLCGRS